jgi:hypothetical protein
MTSLSPTLTTMYSELRDEVGDLVHGWTTLRGMSLDAHTGDVMRRTADRFFALVQAALLSYCVAIVARLLDQASAGGRRTCSLDVLLTEFGKLGGDEADLRRQFRNVRKATRKIVRYRHQRVGHNSFEVMVEGTDKVLFTFAEFDEATRALSAFLNAFERAAELREMDYTASSGRDDLTALIESLSRLTSG